MKGNSPRPRRAEPSPSEPPRCYNCSGFGHIASQCPSPYNISLPILFISFFFYGQLMKEAGGEDEWTTRLTGAK
ncbi:hypothetical protein GCK32_020020 [Trichostrongylus colubriformis]|uniref:CCHC-type domain-containing protein n=1 Tax=Trichostrongylus colubriformis TaxID=6319 RepID=A0AAN8IL15_TRICO